MAHYYEIEDDTGNLVDLVVFCSDWCHKSYCREHSLTYRGWNGCHENPYTVPCASCGETVAGIYNSEESMSSDYDRYRTVD